MNKKYIGHLLAFIAAIAGLILGLASKQLGMAMFAALTGGWVWLAWDAMRHYYLLKDQFEDYVRQHKTPEVNQ